MKKSEGLIYLILIALPSYLIKFSFFSVPLNILDVLIFGSWLFFLITEHHYIRLGSWKYIMGSFVIIGGIAVLVSSNTIAAMGLYKSYIIAPMLVGMMVLTIKPPLYRVLAALSFGLLFVSVMGVVQYITGYGIPAPWDIRGEEFRITSFFDYPNAVGLFLAPIIAMLMAWVIHVPQHRRVFIQLVCLGCIVIAMARTDGAILAVTAALAVSVLFTKWKWLVVAISIVVVGGALLWPPTREVVLLQDTSGEVRLALWEGTLNLLRDRPVFGAGLAGFPELYADYKLDRHVELLLYPHNIVLDFWVELGLAGVVWLVVVVALFFRNLAQAASRQKIVLLAGMVAILVYGLVDVPYFKNDLAVLFWVIITMSSVIARSPRTE